MIARACPRPNPPPQGGRESERVSAATFTLAGEVGDASASTGGGCPTRRLMIACLLALAFPLAACGRKGDPEPPKDADPKAPRRFPTR
jgi:hypothetical protein